MISWLNQNSGLIFAIILPILLICLLLLLRLFSRYRIVLKLWQWVLTFIILITLTGFAGLVISYVDTLDNELEGLIVGCLLGLFASLLFLFIRPNAWGYKCSQIQINVPQFSQMTFIIDDKNRQVAWSLFIETITRLSTQPLGEEEGFLREALNSLHALFGITRELLKSSEPSTNKTQNGMTVEMLAVLMLNNVIRPFLAKWHPLLKQYEAMHPTSPEAEWELNSECRKELENVRVQVRDYARGFGTLAEVKELASFFEQPIVINH